MKKMCMLIVSFLIIMQLSACVNEKEISVTGTLTEDIAEQTSIPPNTNSDEIKFDTLQKLYIDFPQTASYEEAISFIEGTGLPYSEKKQNGGRAIKITWEESDKVIEDMVLETFKDYDYIWIDYLYPKIENDNNDKLNEYYFAGICYITAEGKYQLESHAESAYISRDGEILDHSLNREKQMQFYYDQK